LKPLPLTFPPEAHALSSAAQIASVAMQSVLLADVPLDMIPPVIVGT
jgi:hypothetical protein